jgi:uncharacterized membrane protein
MWTDLVSSKLALIIAGVIVILGALVVARRSLGNLGSSGDGVESPEEILKKRLARGEVSRTDYDRILRELKS